MDICVAHSFNNINNQQQSEPHSNAGIEICMPRKICKELQTRKWGCGCQTLWGDHCPTKRPTINNQNHHSDLTSPPRAQYQRHKFKSLLSFRLALLTSFQNRCNKPNSTNHKWIGFCLNYQKFEASLCPNWHAHPKPIYLMSCGSPSCNTTCVTIRPNYCCWDHKRPIATMVVKM